MSIVDGCTLAVRWSAMLKNTRYIGLDATIVCRCENYVPIHIIAYLGIRPQDAVFMRPRKVSGGAMRPRRILPVIRVVVVRRTIALGGRGRIHLSNVYFAAIWPAWNAYAIARRNAVHPKRRLILNDVRPIIRESDCGFCPNCTRVSVVA